MRYATFDVSGNIAAFYSEDVYGPRTIMVPDPNWTPPVPPSPLPPDYVAPTAPLVSEANPACTIPSSAVPITDAQWADAIANPGKYTVQNGSVIAAATWPSLGVLQAARSQSIAAACQNAVIGGFSSSALGAPHTYPSGIVDQLNMTASVLASLIPGLAAGWTTPIWCSDANGAWSYAAHSAAQVQQAGQDLKAGIVATLQKNATLQAQIAAATSASEIAAVSW